MSEQVSRSWIREITIGVVVAILAAIIIARFGLDKSPAERPSDAHAAASGNGTSTTRMEPVKVAEFTFSSKDLQARSPYSAPSYLTAGQEVWIGVGMLDPASWDATTPTDDKEDYYVRPECRLKVRGPNGTATETSEVGRGFMPKAPGHSAHNSLVVNPVVAYGTMKRCFPQSYMELRFVPPETGQYSIEFEHKLKPEQRGFDKYRICLYQSK